MSDLKKVARAIDAQNMRKARSSLIDFVKYTYKDYQAQWFHELVCEYLDRLLDPEDKEIKKLMIFIPPQHGKSELSSIRFPSYALGKNPNNRIAICSYNSDSARRFNRSCQQVIDDKAYHKVFPGTNLNSKNVSTDAKNGVLRNSEIFETVEGNGYVRTAGVGGALTGYSVDIGIIDDPFKDRKEANSKVVRDAVWDWYTDVFKSRLDNNGIQLMLFTRWHEDDLAGRILDPSNKHYNEDEAKEWTVIALPALKEEVKPLPQAIDLEDPREIDEALWEDKHSAEKYKRWRDHSPNTFSSLAQQRPKVKGGNILRGEDFIVKKRTELPFSMFDVAADAFIDGAYTKDAKNDATGMGSFYFHNGTLYILNISEVRKTLGDFLTYFPIWAEINHVKNYSKVFIEPKASGKDMADMLGRYDYGNWNAIEIENEAVKKGKQTRAEYAEPFLRGGKCVLIEGPWNKKFIDQLEAFPNGTHDDMVDVFTYAVDYYFIKDDDGGVIYTR